MGAFSDVVSSLMTDAGKSGQADKTYCERAVRRAIQGINRAMNHWVIASRTSALSVAANAKTVTLPARARRVRELGYYDAATDRISYPYEEITERDFNMRYAGSQTLTAINPMGFNEWFFVDDAATGELKIRLVFPPSAAFTMMATYFEDLTESNADRLNDEDLLYLSGKARMTSWFPNDKGDALRLYNQAIEERKSAHRSTKRTISEKQHPSITIHNAVGGYLVG